MRRRTDKSLFKYQSLTLELGEILSDLRVDRDARTVSVAVKCVDISWNTKGEGRHLGFFLQSRTLFCDVESCSAGPDVEARKLGERNRLDTCVVLAVNDVR